MYERGIEVVYELRDPDTGAWGHRTVTRLPGWCAGDVDMALALYYLGTRDRVDDVRVVDWSPR